LTRLVAVAVAFVVGSPSWSQGNEHGLHWANSLPEAIEAAAKQKRYVLADFYTDWCTMCKVQDRATFTDPGVVQFLEDRFVCVKVNGDDKASGEQAAQRYDVTAFPSAVVLDAKGRRIGKFSGYFPSSAHYLQSLLDIIKNPLQDPEEFDPEIAKAVVPGKDRHHLAKLYVARAKASIAQRDDRNAVIDCTRAIQCDPQLSDAYIARATARVGRVMRRVVVAEHIADYVKVLSDKARVAALGDLDAAIRLQPKSAEAHDLRAVVEMSAKDYQRAIGDLTTAIKLQPKSTDYRLRRGSCYILTRQFQKAVDNYTQAITSGCASADVYFWRGVAHMLASNYEKASRDLDEAIRLEPDYFKYAARGLMYLRWAKSADAIADYTQAIKSVPGYYYYYFNRARAYELAEQPDESIADYTEAIDYAQYQAADLGSDVYIGRAGAYWKKGDIWQSYLDRCTAIKLLIESNARQCVANCRLAIARITRNAWQGLGRLGTFH